jgi:hypothetical protein
VWHRVAVATPRLSAVIGSIRARRCLAFRKMNLWRTANLMPVQGSTAALGIVQTPLPDRMAILAAWPCMIPTTRPSRAATSSRKSTSALYAGSTALPCRSRKSAPMRCCAAASSPFPAQCGKARGATSSRTRSRSRSTSSAKGVDKIVQDYRANRIVPDFRPSGGNSDQDTADTLDGLHRADSYHFKAQQARDNAFEEAAARGLWAPIASPMTMPIPTTRTATSRGSIRGC